MNAIANSLLALERLLPRAQAAFSQNDIERLFGAVSVKDDARRTVFRRIDAAIQAKLIQRVARGVYLNLRRSSPGKYADAVDLVKPGAIVSLQTVLGDAEVIDNFTTDVVTSVVPRQAGRGIGHVAENNIHFVFHAINEKTAMPDGLSFDPIEYRNGRRATPELAFAHWLYLGTMSNGGLTPPPMEVDIDMLDRKKLNELTKAMDLFKPFQRWLAAKATRDADADVQAHASTRFEI